MVHALKIDPVYFAEVKSGAKTFEVRENDRGFKVGDVLALNELDDTRTGYSGRSVLAEITYILDDERYCKTGYVVLGIQRVELVTADWYRRAERALQKDPW